MKRAIIIATLGSLWFTTFATADVKFGIYTDSNATYAGVKVSGGIKPHVEIVKRVSCKPKARVRVVRHHAGFGWRKRFTRVHTRTVVDHQPSPYCRIVKRTGVLISLPPSP